LPIAGSPAARSGPPDSRPVNVRRGLLDFLFECCGKLAAQTFGFLLHHAEAELSKPADDRSLRGIGNLSALGRHPTLAAAVGSAATALRRLSATVGWQVFALI